MPRSLSDAPDADCSPRTGCFLRRSHLGLTLGHTLAGWLLWLERYDDLAQAPLSVTHAVVGLLATWGILVLWLLPVAALVRLRVEPRPPGAAASGMLGLALRHLGVSVALAVVVLVATRVGSDFGLLPGFFGSFWLLGFVSAGGALLLAHALQPDARWLDPRHPWPTAGQLAPAAAFGWSLFVLLELTFHHFSGAFVLIGDMSAMLWVMRNEAVATIFGPSAPWFLACLAMYGAACGLLALLTVRRGGQLASRRLLLLSGVAGLVGVASVSALESPARALVLHHIHPQVDDLAQVVTSPAPPDADDEAAALRLYPDAPMVPPRPVGMSLAEYGALAATHEAPQPRYDNVLVVFVDTLSRRHLEMYGYERSVAPNLSALARESTRFDRSRTNGGSTDLATVALFYGLRPLLSPDKTATYKDGHGGLPFHLLAGIEGRKVGVFSGDWEIWEEGQSPLFPNRCDFFVDARLAQDEEAVRGHEVHAWAGLREDHLIDALLPWIDARAAAGERFIAYLKLFRAHMPYSTPTELPDGWRRTWAPAATAYTITDMYPTEERRRLVINRYDNAIHFADHHLGRVLDHLRDNLPEVWANTAVILTADHGEAWGEHGWYMHGHHNYEEFFETPLLVRRPGVPGSVDLRMVSLMDVAPTVLDLLGLPPFPDHQGRSLLSPGPRPPFWGHSNAAARLTTLQLDEWKYTENLITGERWLHNLATDPGERRDLAWSEEPDHVERVSALRWLLHAGNAAQLEWADGLRRHPTRELLGR